MDMFFEISEEFEQRNYQGACDSTCRGDVLTKVDDQMSGLESVDSDEMGPSWTYLMWQRLIFLHV